MDNDDELRLECLGGSAPPLGLADDVKGLAALPERVRRDFWEILEPSLADVLDDRVGALAAKFCRERDVTREALAPAIKACRMLFRSGAALGVAPPRMGADLARLGVAPSVVGECLLPCYDKAFALLRERLTAEALTGHGHLVTGFDWRIDAVRASRKTRALNTSVALLTFTYLDGDTRRAITLQMLPDMIAELRRELGTILG